MKRFVLLAVVVLIGAWPAGLVVAAADGFCRSYADSAQASKKRNIFWKCGFRGPRWQATWQENYRWCRAAQAGEAQKENHARRAALVMPRFYIENNTEAALQIEIGSGRACPIGGCKTLFVKGLSRQTVGGFLPIAASVVRVVPRSSDMERQLGELRYKYFVNSRGNDTCRTVKRLVITNRSFGKSVIVGPRTQKKPPAKAGCDPSWGKKYSGQIHVLNVPEDHPKYAKCHDYGHWSGKEYKTTGGKQTFKNLTPGYWVYAYPNWYVWRNKRQ